MKSKNRQKPGPVLEFEDRIVVKVPRKLKDDFTAKAKRELRNPSAVLRLLIEQATYGKAS